MKKVLKKIYLIIYAHMRGETETDKLESANQQVFLYIVLSPISVVLFWGMFKLGIANRLLIALFVLVYIFGGNYLFDKAINPIIRNNITTDIKASTNKNYLVYYTLTFSLLLLIIMLSVLTIAILPF